MKKRLEARLLMSDIDTAAVDTLRQERDASDGPSLPDIGTELRDVVTRLGRVESYIIVARMALDGQRAEQDRDVAVLLRRGVGDLLFKQTSAGMALAHGRTMAAEVMKTLFELADDSTVNKAEFVAAVLRSSWAMIDWIPISPPP
jgi:hypothetical protein